MAEGVFEITVAGRRNPSGEIDVMMVEAGATPGGVRLVAAGDPPSDEAAVVEGLAKAKTIIAESIDLQLELRELVEIAPVDWPSVSDYSPEIMEKVEKAAGPALADLVRMADRRDRATAERNLREETVAAVSADDPDLAAEAKRAFKQALKSTMRNRVVQEGVRLDGRAPTDIRQLTIEVGTVERTHGSGLFQRGETQVLNITTLGMLRMEQMLDDLGIEEGKRYMHHYNFPPFSTGEAGFMRGPRRREIGHGALAEKALLPVVPTPEDFPYALRLVSEVLSSNGSTSMASVCSSSLSLMDAGVPIIAPVAGIAMGLIHQDGQYITLTDILGDEDFMGDMDFKVAGTSGDDHSSPNGHQDRRFAHRDSGSGAFPGPGCPSLHPGGDEQGDLRAARGTQGVDAAHRGDRDTQGQDRRGDRPQGQDGERTRRGDRGLYRDRRDRRQGNRTGSLCRRRRSPGGSGEDQPDRLSAPASRGQGV